jgi:hypothetical protein
MFIYKITKKVFYTENQDEYEHPYGEVMEKCKKDYVDSISKAVFIANSHLSDIELEICSNWDDQYNIESNETKPSTFPTLSIEELESFKNQNNTLYSVLDYKCQYHTFYKVDIKVITVQ